MSELKPCPFCGGEALIDIYGAEGTYKVICDDCGSTGGTRYEEAEAIKAWNSRADKIVTFGL